MTGTAFEHMLQQADLSVVETVMRNVVVFARMRSHQKGQVMDLLGNRGLHHMYNGQQRHIPVTPSSYADNVWHVLHWLAQSGQYGIVVVSSDTCITRTRGCLNGVLVQP